MLRGIAMCIYVIEDAICPISSKRIVCEGTWLGIVAGKVKAEMEAKESTSVRQINLKFILERFT